MRLLDAIMDANQRMGPGEKRASLDLAALADSLPLAALTCIDARLNHLLPEVLGVPEEKFIWLRNAGNIITGPLSSTMRSLSLACLVKGAQEIAIIGHTDCLVSKSTVMALTDRLKALGISRSALPENLIDYFGVFASERQNVLKAVDFVRNSPLIGPKIPVHGLLVDIQTGKIERLVNGYEAPARAAAVADVSLKLGGHTLASGSVNLPGFQLGEMKFPELKIGEFSVGGSIHPKTAETPGPSPAIAASGPEPSLSKTGPIGDLSAGAVGGVGSSTSSSAKPVEPEPVREDWQPGKVDWKHVIEEAVRYRVIGSDQKLYGPVPGRRLLEWIASGHVDEQTPIQPEGTTMWMPLAHLADKMRQRVPLPPVIGPHPKLTRDRRH